MVDKEILNYIKKGVKRGFPIAELKQSLLAKGHADFDVDEAIKEYKSNSGGGKNVNPPGKSLSFFSPKFVLYSIIGILATFVVLFLVIWTNQGAGSTTYLSEGLDQGLSVDLMQNRIELDVNGENKTLKFGSSSETSVSIDYGKDEESLQVGEKKNLDLDDDGIYDLEIRLDAIVGGIPKLYFKKIELTVEEEEETKYYFTEVEVVDELPEIEEENIEEEEEEVNETEEENESFVCEPNWICEEWTDCMPEGFQERNCLDLNQCNLEESMPEMERTCYYQTFENEFSEELSFEERINICNEYETEYLEDIGDCQGEIVSYELDSGIQVKCCKINYIEEECIGEGEIYDFSQFPEGNPCCEGLESFPLEKNSLMIGDNCYGLGISIDSLSNICRSSLCGDGECQEPEDFCSCPEDCVGMERPDYKTIQEFCISDKYEVFCLDNQDNSDLELCNLCFTVSDVNAISN